MRKFLCMLALALTNASAVAQVPVTAAPDELALLKSSDPQLAKNKKRVYDFWREVIDRVRHVPHRKWQNRRTLGCGPETPGSVSRLARPIPS